VQGKGAPTESETPIAHFLTKLKKLHGLTDEKIAEKIGAKYQNVQQWRTSKARPHRTTIRLIAATFGVSEAELLSGVVDETPDIYGKAELKGNKKLAAEMFEELIRSDDDEIVGLLERQMQLLYDLHQRRKGNEMGSKIQK
jgi:transcriptional regulator with XRE-family HTH domain